MTSRLLASRAASWLRVKEHIRRKSTTHTASCRSTAFPEQWWTDFAGESLVMLSIRSCLYNMLSSLWGKNREKVVYACNKLQKKMVNLLGRWKNEFSPDKKEPRAIFDFDIFHGNDRGRRKGSTHKHTIKHIQKVGGWHSVMHYKCPFQHQSKMLLASGHLFCRIGKKRRNYKVQNRWFLVSAWG